LTFFSQSLNQFGPAYSLFIEHIATNAREKIEEEEERLRNAGRSNPEDGSE